MKKFVVATLLLSASVGAAVVSRPVTISRPITVSRPVPVQAKPIQVNNVAKSSNGTNTALVAATAAIAAATLLNGAANVGDSNSQTVSISGDDKDTRITKVSVPFLTLCTAEQFARAVQWQESCHAYAEDNSLSHVQQSCTLLSFQRFCEPATPEQVVGKRLVKSTYTNTFMRD